MLVPDVILEMQDLRFLEWSRIRNSSGTAGSYLKAYSELQGKKIYYKLSCYDSAKGIVGHECVNEIIVDRLLTILGIPHLHYQLIHAGIRIDQTDYETYLCASEDFKAFGDSKIALDDYYELERKEGESVLAFCERMGWADVLYEMLVVDFLILNRDRHGANIEVLRSRAGGMVRLAPMFDHGLSLIYHCRSEAEATSFDPMADKPVQCYIGSRSAMENLNLIPKDRLPCLRRLEKRDREFLFKDLHTVLPEVYLDKIWQLIRMRWRYYENLFDQG